MMEYLEPHHYEIAAKNGISKLRAYKRFYDQGYTLERAITEPVRVITGLWKEWKELAESNGIKMNTFYQRVQKGATPEEAATRPLRVEKGLVPEWVLEKGEENGLDRILVYKRVVQYKWDLEKACTEPKMTKRGGGNNRKKKKGGWK